MKTYVFDLDGTICLPNHDRPDTQGRYAEAKPIQEMIDEIRRCREKGIGVVIYTARRMVTHKGDVQKILEDVGQVTKDWLSRHDVPYDDLVFGKPYGDLYVDDKACLPENFSS